MINYQSKSKSKISETTDFNNCELSVLVGMDNLSYAIYDLTLVDLVELKTITYPFANDPKTILSHLENLYEKESVFQQPFGKVKVIFHHHYCTLVPQAMYEESEQKNYLQYTVKVFDNDTTGVDNLPEVEAKNIYLYPQIIEDFFKDKHGDKYKKTHHTSILINALMRYFSKTEKNYFFVNVYEHTIQIVYLKAGKLEFFNSFLYQTKEDFIYYILFVMEQLGLDTERQPLIFLGQITPEDKRYKFAYKYIRHINFFNVDNFNISEDFYSENPDIQKHFYFELLNQL